MTISSTCRRSWSPWLRCRRCLSRFWRRRFATGLPCRARCAVSSLRAGIPRPSVRFAHCAVPLPGGSLRSPPFAWSPSARVTPTPRFFHRRNLLALALRSMPNSGFAALPGGCPRARRLASLASAPPLLFRSLPGAQHESHFQLLPVLPILRPGSRATVRETLPPLRCGRLRSGAARLNHCSNNGSAARSLGPRGSASSTPVGVSISHRTHRWCPALHARA